MYCGLKSGVLALNIASFAVLFVAAIMDHWIVWPSIPANLGLLRYCHRSDCVFLTDYAMRIVQAFFISFTLACCQWHNIIQFKRYFGGPRTGLSIVDKVATAFGLLLAASIIPITFTLACAIWEVSYARKGRLGCLTYIAVLQFAIGILGFAGMIDGTILLSKLAKEVEGASHYSWTYALGWLGVVFGFGAGALSLYISRIEPKDPVDETPVWKLPQKWQPEVPKFQPPNADWQPQLPIWHLPHGEGSQQGKGQPQHFTWWPNQGVPQAQQTPWQPLQPHQLASQPQQGEMQPQQTVYPYQQEEMKPPEGVCLPQPGEIEPHEPGSQLQPDGTHADQTTSQVPQEGI